MRRLTVALTKGRLVSKIMELPEKASATYEEMKDKNFRKPIFINKELGIRFFLARTNDMPTYAEYGAADIGIFGEGTTPEERWRFCEVLDLGFRKYRMYVCGPESAKELLQRHEMIRVVTKYPRIARDYFYNRKHQTVEIIKLSDSIELAPIMGLPEVVVDIMGTGSTLRENGLTVLEEVCDSSARVIVSQVSMKRGNGRATRLIRDLREVLTGEDAGG